MLFWKLAIRSRSLPRGCRQHQRCNVKHHFRPFNNTSQKVEIPPKTLKAFVHVFVICVRGMLIRRKTRLRDDWSWTFLLLQDIIYTWEEWGHRLDFPRVSCKRPENMETSALKKIYRNREIKCTWFGGSLKSEMLLAVSLCVSIQQGEGNI